jgi:DNA-binding MarR family transcriptional regulator
MPKLEKPEFDELILSKTRLGILSALVRGDKLAFTYLRNALGISDGNLSVQIRKLEEAGYIDVEKVFVGRKPKTFCTISDKGREAVRDLIVKLDTIANPD